MKVLFLLVSGFLLGGCAYQDTALTSHSVVRTTAARLTPDKMRELQVVNGFVNASVREVSDLEHYGRPDVWALPRDGKGDCEDFALLKRKMLIERGWPAKSLSIAVGTSWQGEAHAVLAVATDRGEYVLDNLRDDILLSHQTGHQLVSRGLGTRWVSSTGHISRRPSVDLPVAYVSGR